MRTRVLLSSLLVAAMTAGSSSPAAASDVPDSAKVQRAMLIMGHWDRPGLKDSRVADSPRISLPVDRSWTLREAYYAAVASRKWVDSLPKEELRKELVPLFSRLTRGGIPYASVAYVLAMRGIDVHANVDRVLTAKQGWFTGARPELTEWEKQRVSASPMTFVYLEDFPNHLRRLYEETRHPRLITAIFVNWPGADGAGASGVISARYRLAQDQLPAVVRTVAPNKDARHSLAVLLHDGGGMMRRSERAQARERLRSLTRSDDRALARAARTVLQELDDVPAMRNAGAGRPITRRPR